MATINYNGMELEEVSTPQIFNPPKKMLVWNYIIDYAIQSMIVAIVERMDGLCAICYDGEIYPHCAEIPEAPKPRWATIRELAKWCAQGNGQIQDADRLNCVFTGLDYGPTCDDDAVPDNYKVRKWEDTEWHEPTVDYLGIEP